MAWGPDRTYTLYIHKDAHTPEEPYLGQPELPEAPGVG